MSPKQAAKRNGNGIRQRPAAARATARAWPQAILRRPWLLSKAVAGDRPSEQFAAFQADAPVCDNCGAITVRNGNCYLCHVCGNSLGCS